jgi:hypothetical protein
MWTIKYKGAYINGYCDMLECNVVSTKGHKRCRSLHAAKIAITKLNLTYTL